MTHDSESARTSSVEYTNPFRKRLRITWAVAFFVTACGVLILIKAGNRAETPFFSVIAIVTFVALITGLLASVGLFISSAR
jgi:hypothetical protein